MSLAGVLKQCAVTIGWQSDGTGLYADYQGHSYRWLNRLPLTLASGCENQRRSWESQVRQWLPASQEVLGAVALMDIAKDVPRQTLDYFKQVGVKTVMLTGDAELTGRIIGQQLGIQYVKPKSCLIRRQRKSVS